MFKKNPCSPCPSVCKKYSLDSSDSCSKKYHPHGKSVLFEQSNNALHEELTSDPTGANFATTENSKNHPFKSRIKNIPHSSDDKRRAILRWRTKIIILFISHGFHRFTQIPLRPIEYHRTLNRRTNQSSPL